MPDTDSLDKARLQIQSFAKDRKEVLENQGCEFKWHGHLASIELNGVYKDIDVAYLNKCAEEDEYEKINDYIKSLCEELSYLNKSNLKSSCSFTTEEYVNKIKDEYEKIYRHL